MSVVMGKGLIGEGKAFSLMLQHAGTSGMQVLGKAGSGCELNTMLMRLSMVWMMPPRVRSMTRLRSNIGNFHVVSRVLLM